jgi:type II secretory pathway component PulM
MLNEFKDNTIQKIQQTSSYHSWNSLQVREKQLLKVMAFFLVLAIFYLFIWLPIATNNQQAIKKMHNAEATWQWLNKQQQKTSKFSEQIRPVLINSHSQLTSYLQKQLAVNNLKSSVTEIIPVNSRGKEAIEIKFDKVQSTRFFYWLSKMEQEAILASKLNINKLTTGVIKVEITFEVP